MSRSKEETLARAEAEAAIEAELRRAWIATAAAVAGQGYWGTEQGAGDVAADAARVADRVVEQMRARLEGKMDGKKL